MIARKPAIRSLAWLWVRQDLSQESFFSQWMLWFFEASTTTIFPLPQTSLQGITCQRYTRVLKAVQVGLHCKLRGCQDPRTMYSIDQRQTRLNQTDIVETRPPQHMNVFLKTQIPLSIWARQ